MKTPSERIEGEYKRTKSDKWAFFINSKHYEDTSYLESKSLIRD